MHHRILNRFFSSLWAIHRPALHNIGAVLQSRTAGEPAPALPAVKSRQHRPSRAGVLTLFYSGIIGKHLSAMEAACGGLSVEKIEADLNAAVANPDVSKIVLHLDSPGGVVPGVPELANHIRALSRKKPIIGYCDSMACSAAYWILSACNEIHCTPTATLGSIGVYSAMLDYTGAMEKAGLKMELFKAGDLKAAGLPGTALSDEQRTLLQADVDAIYAMFSENVRKNRPKVAAASMRGQTFLGAAAVAAGLVDSTNFDRADDLARAHHRAPLKAVASVPKPIAPPPAVKPVATAAPAPVHERIAEWLPTADSLRAAIAKADDEGERDRLHRDLAAIKAGRLPEAAETRLRAVSDAALALAFSEERDPERYQILYRALLRRRAR